MLILEPINMNHEKKLVKDSDHLKCVFAQCSFSVLRKLNKTNVCALFDVCFQKDLKCSNDLFQYGTSSACYRWS